MRYGLTAETMAFREKDIDSMFEQTDQPSQRAALPTQEMKKTEDAWLWLLLRLANFSICVGGVPRRDWGTHGVAGIRK
jgi:hypothetical protein